MIIAIKINLVYNYGYIVCRLEVFVNIMSRSIAKVMRDLSFCIQLNAFPVNSNLRKANFIKRHGVDVFSIFVLSLVSVFFGDS